MIISSDQLLYENRTYAVPQARIQNMVKKGDLISLKRGLFETDSNAPLYHKTNLDQLVKLLEKDKYLK